VAAALGAFCCAFPAWASAQQEDGNLRLMNEPHSYTDVVDAFDEDDPFDLNVSAGYEFTYQSGMLQREPGTYDPGSSDPNRLSHNWQDIAQAQHTQNILNLGLDIGIMRDLAIYGRMPIIVSDDRSITAASGMSPDVLSGGVDASGAPLPPLFDLSPGNPFRSPTRSGLSYIAAGLAWSIMNQHREPHLPTWVVMVEGRFNVGTPLTACQQASGGPQCRDWTHSGTDWTFSDTGTNAGMTWGTNALRVETRASWRTRYVEPYGGLMAMVQWPDSAGTFFLPAGNLQGIVNERPPIIGELTGGVAIIPWENRADWARLTIDLRFHGRYVSEGHAYSPLFDALGTSQNPYLSSVNLEGDPTQPGASDLRQVPFFGLTDVQSHAEIGGQLGVEVRAARYVRLGASAALWYVQPYIITFTDACNPNVDGSMSDAAHRGTCRSGIINPDHRPVLDLPGQRFRMGEQIRVNVMLTATAMF
jgi:hypothetical protein